MAIKMEIESEQFQEYQSTDEAETTNKDGNGNGQETEESIKTINISEDEDLLVPKIEPIDVDEAFECVEKQT